MPDLILDKFIIDGYQFFYLPDQWTQDRSEGYGVRRESFPTLNGEHIHIIMAPPTRADNPGYEKRKVRRQNFMATWSESFTDGEMADHLRLLYDLQKPFWMQFDDEMSRCCVRLVCPDVENKEFFTPTFPIAPFGYTPENGVTYNGLVHVDGIPVYTGYTIDSDAGMVRFNESLTEGAEVTLSYTWKMYALITEYDLNPQEIAGEIYRGSIKFTQIPPNYSRDPWHGEYPGADCSYPTTPTVATDVSQPTIPWWSVPSGYSFDSAPTDGGCITDGWEYTFPSGQNYLTCVSVGDGDGTDPSGEISDPSAELSMNSSQTDISLPSGGG